MLRVAVADLLTVAAVWFAAGAAVQAAGGTPEQAHRAALAVVFGAMLGFVGATGGTARSGMVRAAALTLAALPLVLLAVAVRPYPWAAALAMGAIALAAGRLAAHGEPAATLGVLVLYLYFLPFVFGAGRELPVSLLLVAWGVSVVVTVAARAVVSLLPEHAAPARVRSTDERVHVAHGPRLPPLLPDPWRGRIYRNALRSGLALAAGAWVLAATGDHDAVWVMMTIISVLPPQLPLTINRVLGRLLATALAMVVLTAVSVLVPRGFRILVTTPAFVVALAFVRRSYFLCVAAVSVLAVLVYADPLGTLPEALLRRGVDTAVGAAIAVTMALVFPVGPLAPSTADDDGGSGS
jgi:hypothetical protein